MASSDLIRSMRSGGGTGVAAAREFFRLAQSGGVSKAELKEAQAIVTSPELQDAFRDVAQEFSALLSGGEGVFRDVHSLTPNRSKLTDARTMPERFLGDFTLVEHQLLQHPGLTRAQKAERLFEFFEAYASRFQELAHAEPNKGEAPVDLPKVLAQFDKALQRAGFQHLTTGDGRTGLQAARQMLETRTPAELLEARPTQLDAPGWKDSPRLATGRPQDLVPLLPQQVAQRSTAALKKEEEEERRRKDKGSGGVLGSRMVWNVLHLLRDDDLTDVERRDAMNQLVMAAGLVLLLVGIIVGVLVWM